jgi:propionyl-CoA carboxylase alpha chain
MQHQISAPVTGTLSALHVAPGRQVEVGALLAVVDETVVDETAESAETAEVLKEVLDQ